MRLLQKRINRAAVERGKASRMLRPGDRRPTNASLFDKPWMIV